MVTSLFFILFVGIATAEYGWKPGTQYNYNVRGRTVTGLNQIANQFTGILMHAKLNIQAKSDSTLSLQITGAKYAEIHRNLSNGWDTHIPDESLNYIKLSLHNGPFELYLDDGIIKELTVDQSLPTWELNILKSIVSLLQVDVQGGNVIQSQMNQIQNSDISISNYKTMEDSVNGVYETIYDISEIPEYILQSRPEMLPLPHLLGNGKVFEIVKNKNFSNSDRHVLYHSGLDSQTNWKPGSNQMGNFLTRTSISQIIVSGNLKQYTIQSSTTTDKIIVAPHLYNKQRGMVGSRFNLTLESVNSIKLPFPVVSNPRRIRNLVYEYNLNAPKSKDMRKNMKEGISDYNLDGRIDLHSFYTSSSKDFMDSNELNYLSISKLSEASPLNYVTFTDKGKSKNDVLNSTRNIIKLAHEIGQGIVSPNALTGEQTLHKFSLLVRLTRTMSTEQLKEVSETLYYPYLKAMKANSIEIVHNYQTWISFRDAVGQSGTGPALMTIRDWISSNKIVGEEASHLIMSLSESPKYPTNDYINYFFDMLNDEVIQNHVSLRTSVVLSFTELVRKAIVDPRATQKNYPALVLESVKMKNDSAIIEKYVTYFQQQLHESVLQKNSVNIQLYIRALNNIAHPYTLKVFKPYLEGKALISRFQRFTIIASMDKIVKLYPNLVRTVLFRIYNNMADTPEIRTAAVMQLIKTNPPVLMLQSMAQQTNFDENKQVNAAVKSAIESTAKQEVNQYNKDIVHKARAAVNMLNPENYGLHYSRNFINSFIVKERNLAYKHHLAYIQDADNIYPSSFFYNLKNSIGGYKHNSHEVNFMTSSTSKLIDLLYDGFFWYNNEKKKREKKINLSNSKWSLHSVYNSLNFEKEENKQLEGHILATILGAKRYFSFDNNTFKNFPDYVAEIVTTTINNNRLNFTKLYNQYSMEIMFPTTMGFPFIYTLETPTLVNLGIQLTGAGGTTPLSNHSIENLSVAGNQNLLYSTQKEGKIGFITPYNGKMYTASLERNIHLNIPVKMEVNLNLKNSKITAKLEPIEKHETQKLFEYSTRAFTSVVDSNKINSLMTRKDTQLVQNEPIKIGQKTFGKEKYGFSFDIKMETEKTNLNLNYIYNHLKGHDMVSLASFVDLFDEISYNNYSITFDPRKSWSKNMEISISYNKTDSLQESVHTKSDFSSHNRETRKGPSFENKKSYQKELFKNVAANIKDAQTNLIQLKMGFKGLYETEYELIFASSNSYKSNITRILAFMKNSTTTNMEPKTYVGALELTTIMPRIPLVKHETSLNTLSPSKVKGRFVFGERPPYKSQIMLEGDFRRSQERLSYLQKHPLVILCEKQIQMGYKIQSACRNVSRRINYLDKYQFRINYEQIPNDFKNVVYAVYRYINNLWYDYNTEAINIKENGENIDVEVKFGKNLLSSNLSIITPYFSDKYVSVPIHEWIRPLVVLHPQYSMMRRLGHKIMVAQEAPTCVYDKDQITTFDNRTYYVNLGDKYHILTQYVSKNNDFEENENDDEYFSIITGQRSLQSLDLSIIVGDDVLEVTQGGDGSLLNLIYNGKQVVPSDDIKELHDYSGSVIFKVLPLSEGAVKIIAEKHGFEIIHDGNHLTIEVSNKFRNKLRGLCGNFDGELYNEFITPQNCIASDREQFIASYGLSNKKNNGVTKYPKTRNNECYRKKYFYGTVVNEEEVNKYIDKRRKKNYEETIKKRLLKEMIESSTTYIP
ncbi:vitellogenin [Halyomorpha halys]|uniref:vitellogenin n=1 Tax=Halyomorpha halys TaxID=286706 RepID=UPI0006D5249A|nr:vitellogenin [Halyomorpha halys]